MNNKLTDDEVLSECLYQASQASGSEFAADELTESRQDALKAYLGKPIGNEIDGNSTVQSMDVADMIDAMLSQIMPSFTQDNIVQFEAHSEDDEEQARIESNFCNYVVMEQNQGFTLLETLIKDTLLSKNCIAKVSVDIKEDVEKETYKDLDDLELFQVIQPTKENQVIDVTEFDEKSGKVSLKRITTKRKLVVDAVAPENFSITPEHKSPYLDDCMYCNERYYVSKSDLIEEGYDFAMVMDLPPATSDTKPDSIERNQIDSESEFYNRNPSMQMVEIFEHYIRIDQDGDGIAELHKVLSCQTNLLSNEEVDCVPYANGVAWLMGHRFYGLSAYDKLKYVQASKTHFLRQMEDNARAGNHQKTRVIEDQVEMDDFLNGRHNAVQRVESQDSAMDVPFYDITPSCIMIMDYWDKVRTERTGSALDLQANQMTMPSNVGDQGVNTLIANLEQVSALVTRNLSETLVYSLYSLVHKFLRLYFPQEMRAKISGKWGSTNPSQWLEREQINVTIPPTRSERIQQQIALEKAILHSTAELQQGKAGVTTSEGQIYQLKLDHMRMSGIDHPEKYLINPESPEAQQAAQINQAMQQQEMARQEQKQDALMMAQLQLQSRQVDNQQAEVMRNYEADKEELAQKYDAFDGEIRFKYAGLEKAYADLKQKYDEMYLKAEVDEAKIIGDATTKLEIEGMKNESNVRNNNAGENQESESKDMDEAV